MAKLLARSRDENSSLKTIQGEECQALIFQRHCYLWRWPLFMAHFGLWQRLNVNNL